MKNKLLKVAGNVFILAMIFCFTSISFAAEANSVPSSPLFGKLTNAVNQISTWLIGISTAAALIGIVTGQLMVKLSFGNEEQIIKGKNLTKNVVWAYAVVAGSSLILKAIDYFVK